MNIQGRHANTEQSAALKKQLEKIFAENREKQESYRELSKKRDESRLSGTLTSLFNVR
ncbi:MAG: hypothetical protein H8D24_01345 [Gammaproteobacteria bacterium]|uniref:Uncharacterized protein n=1 Tax=Candidatus Thiopontia autotrophica TaxID=2841688 RepID=A0A8J6PAQ1_9GAMM|nr:hypothetical protein [Candidatus Thiopontia autotrophica]